MIGFKLNSDGDIYREDNKIAVLSTVQEYVRQRLQIKFRTFQTEWWLDQSFGMPYKANFEGGATILGKGMSKQDIDALFVLEARKEPEVIRIEYFNSKYNSSTRLYDVNFEVVTRDGLLRAEVVSLQPYEEDTYPTPNGSALKSACGFNALQDSVDIHETVHWYYPQGATFGWISDLDIGLDSNLALESDIQINGE